LKKQRPNISIVILAAGGSRRMGRPKQLLLYRGKTMLRHVVETALATGCGGVFVVVGAHATQVRAEIAALPVTVVENSAWEQGMSSSLCAGLSAVQHSDSDVSAVLLLTADQPLISVPLLAGMIETFVSSGKDIVACSYAGTRGVPALFARTLFSELMTLNGDKGAKAVLQRHAGEVATVAFPEGACDVDTDADYQQLQILDTPAAKP
jgi:molybdenum cofactor cytidylyltransferase